MKLHCRLDVSQTTSTHTFDFEDLNISKEDWSELPPKEKHRVIHEAVLDLYEQPYWVLDDFEEQD